MVKCTKHKHSSEETAVLCHARHMARRVKIKTRGSTGMNKVQMRKNRPPRLTKHGEVWMLIWEEDGLMEY